jgi:predicted Zn-dependent peptidase
VVVRGSLLTERVRLLVGACTVGRRHADRWALEVLAEVLREELMAGIRYRRGLVYGLGAHNAFFDDTGYFGVSTTSDRGHREAILDAIDGYLERVRQHLAALRSRRTAGGYQGIH